MPNQSLAKTQQEQYEWVFDQYRKENPNSFKMEEVMPWAVSKGLVDLPLIDPMRELVKKGRKAARAARTVDAQGREVRKYLPAKVPTSVDENGNGLLFETRYDHIHRMSVDHAMLTFDQRDQNIRRQKESATRDRDSFVENNPNAEGSEHLFEFFDFMREPIEEAVVEVIEEDSVRPSRPR